MSPAGPLVALLVCVLLPLILQPALAALASNGDTKAIWTAWWGSAGLLSSLPAAVFGAHLCLLGLAWLLYMAPQVLRWRLPWKRAKDAKVMLPRWLAAFAAAATWLYVVLLHFEGGPLRRYR